MESRKRSIAKTASFRILATLTTLVLVLVFTGNLLIAGLVSIFELVSKLAIYYAHERAWDRISWGRRG